MITEKEKSILLSALNAYWYDHKMKLTSNTLGDIERKITQEIVDESKRLIDDFEQKLNIHGVSGKRPDCPYCMEPISKEAIEAWQIWLDKAKAACASGAVDKTVSVGCPHPRGKRSYIGEGYLKCGECGEEFK